MIEVEGLVVEVPGFRLQIPRLRVEPGEYLAVLGPSGVGKTLLILALVGIVKPRAGRIIVDGRDVTRLPPERRGIALVPQEYALFPHMTVFDNIAYGLRMKKLPEGEVEERVKRISRLLGIDHLLDRKPATLSGGEKQRVALARALVVEPKLLLLDEPLAALDPQTKLRALQLLKRLHSELGFTALHVTHNLAEAIALADRIAYMESGRLLGVYTTREFLRTPHAKPYIEEALLVAKTLANTQPPEVNSAEQP